MNDLTRNNLTTFFTDMQLLAVTEPDDLVCRILTILNLAYFGLDF